MMMISQNGGDEEMGNMPLAHVAYPSTHQRRSLSKHPSFSRSAICSSLSSCDVLCEFAMILVNGFLLTEVWDR